MQGFIDANFAQCEETRKSTTKFLIKVYCNNVQWGIRKQNYVSLSTMESEYVALGMGITETLWIRNVLTGMNLEASIEIFEDNKSCISVVKDPCNQWGSKHIDIKYHFIRYVINKKKVNVNYININLQQVDLFTKLLNEDRFGRLKALVSIAKI